MQKILAKKTVSMTDMRDPKKVLEFAGNDTVAVLNRNQTVGYFTPSKVAEENSVRYADMHDVRESAQKMKEKYQKALDYLQDK